MESACSDRGAHLANAAGFCDIDYNSAVRGVLMGGNLGEWSIDHRCRRHRVSQLHSPSTPETSARTPIGETLSRKLSTLRFLLAAVIVLVHAENLHLNFAGGSADAGNAGAVSFVEYAVSHVFGKSAVPLFCFISGMLAFRPGARDFRSTVKRRFRSVAVPYLFWSGAAIAIFFTASRLRVFGPLMAHEPFHVAGLGTFAYLLFVAPIPSQLWYLRNLFVCSLFAPLIMYLLKRFKVRPWTLAGTLLSVWLAGLEDPYRISQTLAFFCAGGAVSLSNSASPLLSRKARSGLLPLVVVGWFVLGCVLTARVLTIPLLASVLHRIEIVLGAVASWMSYDDFSESIERYVSPLAGFSFFIFLAHEPFQGFLMKLSVHLLHPSPGGLLLLYFGIPLVVILALVTVGFLARRKTPTLYSVVVGGRI